ncbi:HAMP domain-containing sensor histidine kinase [Streptomyces heilongjiangensis]|uniref:histidine kinase n=1 Tax=Streptomyces heilongjiangensis TaxID=945052 RepID=A0ABW1BB06_9ACTN|nr:HAMP domain-containing sensor histidine kinase [Streptomyces heilongjiangensis]MDC2950510.1 HAMP domain-containing sensor histidine kinase [Streptomyces heilongjiangensis]
MFPRGSLRSRLLVMSVLVSLCSIVATAWLVVSVTAVAIGRERGQAITDDARVYDTLLGFAATHPDWRGVQPTVRDLARETGRRITLTDENRRLLADSGQGGRAAARSLPDTPSATVDALAVDPTLVARRGSGPSEGIDPRAVGPFRLTGREKADLDTIATRVADCFRDGPVAADVDVVHAPSGRPEVWLDGRVLDVGDRCEVDDLLERTPTESRALAQLGKLVNRCLADRHASPVRLFDNLTWTPSTARGAPNSRAVTACLSEASRDQLDPYVAPAALLFATAPERKIATFFDLSDANRMRIAGVTAAVLLITVTVTFVAGTRMVRPLRALTGAAERMAEGDEAAQVEVSGRDEFGKLAAAFNLMSRRRRELEQLRRALVSDVAHELRTPLSNVRGWLEAVEDGVVPADKRLISSLLEEALLLQHIIDDLRDLAAADAGALRVHPEDVDAAALLAQVGRAHQGSAGAAGVKLVWTAHDRPSLRADSVRLRQAIGNLVSNAIRHTPEGGTVSLSVRARGDQVLFSVEDTGSGISEEDLSKVFDRFWRAEKSRSRQGGGSGLGLSIVRKLVEAHGGTVHASSVLGEGSVFTLGLPGPSAGQPEPRLASSTSRRRPAGRTGVTDTT